MSLKECASSQLPKGENPTKSFFRTKCLSPSSILKPFDVSKISIKCKTVENNYVDNYINNYNIIINNYIISHSRNAFQLYLLLKNLEFQGR